MTRLEAKKLLTEPEIVSLDPASHALFAALALEMLYAGKPVKAKLVAGPWKAKAPVHESLIPPCLRQDRVESDIEMARR